MRILLVPTALFSLIGLLCISACGLDGLSSELYTTPQTQTSLEPLECQPDQIRCFGPTDYGVCDAQGRISGIGSCPAQSLCVLGASSLERPCLPYRNRCEENEPFSVDNRSFSFKDVQTLKSVQRSIQLRNCGPDRLVFSTAELIGTPTFALTQPPPLGPLDARRTITLKVAYNPSITSSQEQGELRIPISRIDPESGLSVPLTILRIPLEGREDTTFTPPISSQEFDFGLLSTRTTHVQNIELRNTGQQDTTLRGVLTDEDPEGAGEFLRIEWPSFPLNLSPGETLPLRAVYRSELANTTQITHTLLLEPWPADRPYPTLTLRAQSTDEGACHENPVPSITVATTQDPPIVAAQTDVLPMTPIFLGVSSEEHGAHAYQFKLTRKPRGSATVLSAPSDELYGSSRSFIPDIAGPYAITLKTLGENNIPSCYQSAITVYAWPQSELHLELSWISSSYLPHGAGPDLDLILERSKRTNDPHPPHETWIEDPNVCFWLNSNPDWGTLSDHVDDCRMLRQDNQNWGPEILEVTELEDRPYTARVYVRNDRGFGEVFATLNVYLRGELRASYISTGLQKDSSWEVVEILPSLSTLREINEITPP